MATTEQALTEAGSKYMTQLAVVGGLGLLLCLGAPGMFYRSGTGGGNVWLMRHVLSGYSCFVMHSKH